MDPQCCIGTLTNELCHRNVYGVVPKGLRHFSEYSSEEKSLLSLRISSNLSLICKYHEIKFLSQYNHLFGRICCDPLKVHKKSVSKGLREIKMDYIFKEKHFPVNIVPGKSLCPTCYTKIFVRPTAHTATVDNVSDEYVDKTENMVKVDAACSSLELSPAAKIKKLSSDKRKGALKAKYKKVSEAIRKKLEICFDEDIEDSEPNQQSLSFEYDELIEKLKKKCLVANKETKVQIISLLPNSWSRDKIATEFNVSVHLVRLSRKLVKDQGILPVLGKKKGVRISDVTAKKVVDFFEDDEYSRLCPGKKDFVSVKIDGQKVYKQKRLMLCNLNELYVEFKNKHLECGIQRSKFCEMKPKWCILAGASGTHTVCVCLYHQNVKLMIEGAKLNVDYKELLDMMVCDMTGYKCMMEECDQCPGQQAILEMFTEAQETDEIPERIFYKQWVTVDRAEMLTLTTPRDEFFETLAQKLDKLKKHHYISKVQSQFLKDKKASLNSSECLVLADFAENFSFVIQDEIQSHHWVNRQATIHPFVYYCHEGGQLKHQSICIISDHMEHNTAAVHTFQTHLIRHIKATIPEVKKIIYYSDGASSQYKNKKNFANICNHKKDFGLDCEWHFFASSHGKNACDGVGGTTKREATRASLQRASNNQILTPNDLFNFCSQHIQGIIYFYVTNQEVQGHAEELRERFDSCQQVLGTRSYHRFDPLSESKMRCYVTSCSTDYVEVHVSKFIPLTVSIKDTVACVYDGQWWLGEVDDISVQNRDIHVIFYHPAGPRTSFQKNNKDSTWVPLTNVLRKLNAMELTTSTGRSHNIEPHLSEEISHLLVKHQM